MTLHLIGSVPVFLWRRILALALLGLAAPAASQPRITVEAKGNVVLVQSGANAAFGAANLFDLNSRSIDFEPLEDGSYAFQTAELNWIEAGQPVTYEEPRWPVGAREMELPFEFPFAGRAWRAVWANETGSLSFGFRESPSLRPRYFEYARFANQVLVFGQPMIAALWRWNNQQGYGGLRIRFSDESAVFSWDVSEGFNSPAQFLQEPRPSRFQVVLFPSGAIRLSYDLVGAGDGIAGLFPGQTAYPEPLVIATNAPPPRTGVPGHVQIQRGEILKISNSLLRTKLTMKEPPPSDGSPLSYRVFLDLDEPFESGALPFDKADCVVEALRAPSRSEWTFRACGAATTGAVRESTVSVDFSSHAIRRATRLLWFADAVSPAGFTQMPGAIAELPASDADLPADFSNVTEPKSRAGAIFESFHYAPALLTTAEILQHVYREMDDQFDFFALYSGIRIDAPEAGTSGSGPLSDAIGGIGIENVDWVNLTGSAGRLQAFQNISWIESLVNRESGATDTSGAFSNFELATALLAHEMGHRWGALTRTSDLNDLPHLRDGSGHWLFGLHAPSASPVTKPTDSGVMGGRFWHELDQGEFRDEGSSYGAPSGYSHLELYLMGLLPPEEAPATFLLENLQPVGWKDGPVFRGDKREVTIQAIIHQMGQRWPHASKSQRNFRTGFILVTEAGHPEIDSHLSKVDGIRLRWERFWKDATGGRSSMATDLVKRVGIRARVVSGNAQIVRPAAKPKPVVFEFLTAEGKPEVNAQVHLASDRGILSNSATRTDSNGRIRVEWTAPEAEGALAITASISDGVSATMVAEVIE